MCQCTLLCDKLLLPNIFLYTIHELCALISYALLLQSFLTVCALMMAQFIFPFLVKHKNEETQIITTQTRSHGNDSFPSKLLVCTCMECQQLPICHTKLLSLAMCVCQQHDQRQQCGALCELHARHLLIWIHHHFILGQKNICEHHNIRLFD